MKKFLEIAKGAVIAMGMTGIAHANNEWTGFYAGVNSGLAFYNAQLKSQQFGFTDPSETCNRNSSFSILSSGVQLGYLYQFSNDLVAGIEANVTLNVNQTKTLNCISNINPEVYDRFTFRNQMQSAIKARAGHALNLYQNIFLPYLMAGASFAKLGLTYRNEGGNYYSTNKNQAGWLIGAGIEWILNQNWSLRAEYYYLNYGNAINLKIPSIYGLVDPNGGSHLNLSANNIVIALNYWV